MLRTIFIILYSPCCLHTEYIKQKTRVCQGTHGPGLHLMATLETRPWSGGVEGGGGLDVPPTLATQQGTHVGPKLTGITTPPTSTLEVLGELHRGLYKLQIK